MTPWRPLSLKLIYGGTFLKSNVGTGEEGQWQGRPAQGAWAPVEASVLAQSGHWCLHSAPRCLTWAHAPAYLHGVRNLPWHRRRGPAAAARPGFSPLAASPGFWPAPGAQVTQQLRPDSKSATHAWRTEHLKLISFSPLKSGVQLGKTTFISQNQT